jgi:hypothetical protein
MRLPLAALVITACLAMLLSAARAAGAALPRGTHSGCIVHFQRFAIARHSVFYRVTHHDLSSGARMESRPVPAIERRYQTLSPDKRHITAARLESVAAFGDSTFRLIVRPYGRGQERVLAENIRVHDVHYMTPALWTSWTADGRVLHYAWQTPSGESFLAAYDVQRERPMWRVRTDGRATYRLLALRDEAANADRPARATSRADRHRLPCAPLLFHPDEAD